MLSDKWIDKVKEELKLKNDYAVSKVLGVSTGKIGGYRSGRAKTFDDDMCLKIAEVLKIDPMEIIADQGVERAKSDEVRNFWGKMTGSVVTSLLRGLIILGVALYAFVWFVQIIINATKEKTASTIPAIYDSVVSILC